jgi:hypothetical protein
VENASLTAPMPPPTIGTRRPIEVATRFPPTLATSSWVTSTQELVERRVVRRRRGDPHRRRRQSPLLHQVVDAVLTEHAGEYGVADAVVVEVVAAQVRDRRDHVALQQRQAGDVGRDRERERDHAAEVGGEPLHAGEAHVCLDDAVDGALHVAAVGGQPPPAGLGRAGEAPEAVDGQLEHLPDEPRRLGRCDPDTPWRERLAESTTDAHGSPSDPAVR